MRTILIDDEITACENLEALLKLINAPVEIIAKIHDVETAIEKIDSLNPELIFLDIQLPTGTGFSILEKIKNKNQNVVFVTAYDEYAIKAFKYSAIDYLLKPINIQDLEDTINRVNSKIGKEDQSEKVNALIYNKSEKLKKLVINSEQGYIVIDVNKVIRAQSSGNYTEFYLEDGTKFISSKLLKNYDETLQFQGFFRVHRSHLININHVHSYTKGIKPTCTMSDGCVLEISREKKEQFFNFLEQ